MKKAINILINLMIPFYVFVFCTAMYSIINSSFRILKTAGSVPRSVSLTAPAISYILFGGMIISLIALLVWIALIIKIRGKRYLFDTPDATAITLIIWIIGSFKGLLIYTFYVTFPFANLINLIK